MLKSNPQGLDYNYDNLNHRVDTFKQNKHKKFNYYSKFYNCII